ncbi:MAG: SDR family NAD(P)-dependent oxidoreductase [Bryobacteraceae bacterium]
MGSECNVLITGASRGLGEATAREFWNSGASLILTARHEERLDALREALLATAATGQRIHCIAADLSNAAGAEFVLRAARERVRRLDVLVNNAAVVGPIGKFWENEAAAWTETLQVNLLAPAELMRGAIPWMAAGGGGVIINLSGGGATSPRPNFSAYATAKAALVRLSETVAVEAEPLGVRVHCVAPGAMNTEMLEAVLRAAPESEYGKALQQKENGGADPRVAARLCVFLAGDDAASVTGRLFSAVWDPWERMGEWAGELRGSDIYTLRRIVPEDRGKDWK